MTANASIRVLVADDHPVFREGLSHLVDRQDDMEVVAEAANGRDAVNLFTKLRPSVTMMDLRMPEMSGVEAIRAIRQIAPSARIVILTTFDGDADIFEGLAAGASGYLLKDADRHEIIDAIRSVAAGRKVIPAAVASKLAERIGYPELTRRETHVLELVAQGNSNLQIAVLLGITEGTVKSHVSSIMQKLNASDRTHAVVTALRRGILRG